MDSRILIYDSSVDLEIAAGEARHEASQALFTAVENGDLEGVSRALDSGFELPDMGAGEKPWENHPLLRAAAKGHLPIVALLHSRGVDVSKPVGYTASYHAARCGHSAVLAYLLDAGVDVHDRNEELLYVAALFARVESVRVLLEKGASIERCPECPLAVAASNGSIPILQLMLEKGANVNVMGGAALSSATWEGHTDVVKFLLENGADKAANDHQALKIASERKHVEIMRLLS